MVILDVDTRWNSTYAMLKRLKRLRPAIEMFIANEKGALEDDDWNILENILKLLKPLDDITNYLSKSKFPSLSTVIPAYEACMDEIAKVASQIPSLLTAQKAIHSKLNRYYMAALEKNVYAASTILDPRFKHNYFKKRREATTIKRQFLKDAEKFAKYAESEPGIQARNDGDDEPSSPTWIDRMFKKFKTTTLEEEVGKYLAEPVSSQETDPIDFWKSNSKSFPCLSAMSQVYLSVPATSTPSERGFSGGRLICHHTRGSLSAEKLSALMCLNSWIKNGFEKKK